MVLSMEKWIGKVAVVTGASSGIGSAIAVRLIKEGVKVVGLARRVEIIEENSKKFSNEKGVLHGFKTDVTKQEDILKAFKWTEETLGPISILINCAGIIKYSFLMYGRTEDWEKVVETNVIGLCVATREAIKSMQANKIDGNIIHMNSCIGHVVPRSSGVASKFSVTALTECLRQELIAAGSKIKISSVSPGLVETEMTEGVLKNFKQRVSLKDEDVVDAVIYVLSTPPHVQIHEIIIKPVGEKF